VLDRLERGNDSNQVFALPADLEIGDDVEDPQGGEMTSALEINTTPERPDTHLERLRRAELELVLGWFAPGQHVLELGAGSGYQASVLASRGCNVTALDIATRPRKDAPYYPVRDYDGRTIPVPDASVDVVFSSHVLEHVDPIEPLLAETHRVMRSDAVAVHILPSSTWRIWTSLAHFPFIAKTLLFGRGRDSLVNVANIRDATDRHGVVRAITKSVVHPFVAHGSRGNAAAEVRRFRKSEWIVEFARNGFEVIDASPTKLFYTGYGVFPSMSLARRRSLASFFGSGSRAFVLRKLIGASREDSASFAVSS
jgi:SAM-dependent methyltransferase